MLGLFSDQMKFTVVNESLSIIKQNDLYGELFNCFNFVSCFQCTSLCTQTLYWIKVHCILVRSLLTLNDPCHMWLFTPATVLATVTVDTFMSHHCLFNLVYCLFTTVFHTYRNIVIT